MRRIGIFALLLLIASKSYAMNYEYVEYYDETTLPKKLKMSGEIIPGDYQKLLMFLKDNKPQNSYFGFGQIELDSTGGNIKEAMKLAQLIKKAYPSIWIKNACASSCVLLWLSGATRYVDEGGRLGIHRPTFPKSYYETSSLEESKKNYENLSNEFKDFLLEQGLPISIYEKLMATESTNILWLQKKDLELIGKSPAYLDEMQHKLCDGVIQKSIEINSDENNSAASKCLTNITESAQLTFFDEIYGKQNADWLKVKKMLATGNSVNTNEASTTNTVSEEEIKNATEILTKIHPDWIKVSNSKQFKAWRKSLSEEIQNKLNVSNDPYFIAGVISEYKKIHKKAR